MGHAEREQEDGGRDQGADIMPSGQPAPEHREQQKQRHAERVVVKAQMNEAAEGERQQQQDRQRRSFALRVRDGEGGHDPDQPIEHEEDGIGEQRIAGQADEAGNHGVDGKVRLDARIPLIERRRGLRQRAAPTEPRDQIRLRQMHRPVLGGNEIDQPHRSIQQQHQRREKQRGRRDGGNIYARDGGRDARHVSGPDE